MTWLKIKFAVGVGVAVLLAGGAATVAISQSGTDDEWTPQEIAKQSQDAYAALSSYSDSGTVMAERGGANIKTVFNIRLQRPNLYRIDWTQTGGSYTSKGVVWSDGSGDFFVMETAGQEKNAQPEKMENMQMALASATGVSSSAAATIPRIFFKQNRGDVLSLAVLGRTRLKKESDAQAGGVDCFVVSSVLDPVKMPNNMGTAGTTTTTLWIGKRDHLIHQTRISVEGMSLTLPRQSDADIQATLERLKKPATPEAIAAWRRQTETSSRKAQSSKYVYIQTDENISLNKNFSPADFAR